MTASRDAQREPAAVEAAEQSVHAPPDARGAAAVSQAPPRSPRPAWSPWLTPAAVAIYLLLAYLAIWAVDARGALGGPVRLQEVGINPPFVWIQLFMQGGLTEIIQWGLLATLVILAAALGASYRREAPPGAEGGPARSRARFWTLVAIVGALMLIEDAGDPRHLLHQYAVAVSGGNERFTTAVEALYFASIMSIGLYAFLRHGLYLVTLPGVRLLGALGVTLYAGSVLMNLTRRSGEWYTAFGGWLVEDLFRVPQLFEAVAVGPLDPTGLDIRFFFVDFVIEESLEVMGAAFLVAAVVAYARARADRASGDNGSAHPSPGSERP